MSRAPRSAHEVKGVSLAWQEPINITADPPLSVQFLPGDSPRLVVCFAGVGRQRGATPPREFTGSASGGGQNHVLFVSDASRSWMNGFGISDRIAEIVRNYVDFHGIEDVAAIGNSMGGFAACVLAQLIEVRTVIAFSPQYSPFAEHVPEETRWSYFRDVIEGRHWPHIGAMAAEGTRYFLLHGDHPMEAIHWLRMPEGPQVQHLIFQGIGHDVAARLRKRRLLGPVIDLAIAGKPRKMRLMIERSKLGRRFEVFLRQAYVEAFPEVLGHVRPAPPGPESGEKGSHHD